MSEAVLSSNANNLPEWLGIVREKVESLRFGVVQLVVHDGRVTQIERTEKTRIPPGVRESDSDWNFPPAAIRGGDSHQAIIIRN